MEAQIKEYIAYPTRSLKIGFCGASGTGKTTLVEQLRLGLPRVTNLTRKVSVELRGTNLGQQQILSNYSSEFKGKRAYVTDRTIFDICTYSLLLNIWSPEKTYRIINEWVSKIGLPDILFYIPVEFALPDDGRCPAEWDRRKFSAIMISLLDKYNPNYVVLRGSVEERLKEANNAIKKHLAHCGPSPTDDPRTGG